MRTHCWDASELILDDLDAEPGGLLIRHCASDGARRKSRPGNVTLGLFLF